MTEFLADTAMPMLNLQTLLVRTCPRKLISRDYTFISVIAPWRRFQITVESNCTVVISTLGDWLKNLALFFSQWHAKPITPNALDFSRAFSKLQVIVRNSDCFITLFALVVIRWSR